MKRQNTFPLSFVPPKSKKQLRPVSQEQECGRRSTKSERLGRIQIFASVDFFVCLGHHLAPREGGRRAGVRVDVEAGGSLGRC